VKDTVDVAVMQFSPDPLDPERNRRRMAEEALAEAERRPADLIVFPELATTGYVPLLLGDPAPERLRALSEPVPGPTTEALGAVAARTGAHIAVGLSECDADGRLFNSLALVAPGGDVVALHRKVHLFDEEARHHEPGDRFDVARTELGMIGLSVCYDSRFPEAARMQALAGAEILICVFAYAPDPGVPRGILTYRAIVRAWENSVFYVLGNRVGNDAGVEFVGGSVVTGPFGETLSEAGDGRAPVVRARLTAEALAAAGGPGRLAADRRPDIYGDPQPREEARA
jgi:predicted amidohydrolase